MKTVFVLTIIGADGTRVLAPSTYPTREQAERALLELSIRQAAAYDDSEIAGICIEERDIALEN